MWMGGRGEFQEGFRKGVKVRVGGALSLAFSTANPEERLRYESHSGFRSARSCFLVALLPLALPPAPSPFHCASCELAR